MKFQNRLPVFLSVISLVYLLLYPIPAHAQKGRSLLDNTAKWSWVYTEPKTGIRFAEIYGGAVTSRTVVGEVPNTIDLANDEHAKQFLKIGKDISLQKTGPFKEIYILLYVGSYWTDEQEIDVSGYFEANVLRNIIIT